ncbi:MAG: 1-acyl-sn-glycerol-3-phosphate acyltransferase [Clostridia bacterium]|nr:1-acyl-sn-glycerol-3-phosphate acyltransferase [Clostridia bacterium]
MKKEKWIKPRHKVVRDLAYLVMYPYMKWKCGVAIEKFKEQGGRQYLIIMNHQTVFDQFMVGCAFKGPVYYIATEDIFSMGWISKLIRFLVNPIPIKKQTNDLKAVKTCIRVVKEGGTIALAPEGNRTYSGRLCYIKPSIVKLMRVLKLPLAIFRIEGGYGVQPRWADDIRKGKMRTYVSRVVEPEEYQALTDEEMMALITKELGVDEAALSGEFRHKNLAQYLERAIYVCPHCGLAEFESCGDVFTCKKCGRQIRYLPTRELAGIGHSFPFRFVADWYEYQADYVRKLPLSAYEKEPAFRDTADLSEVLLYQRKVPLRKEVQLALYSDRITADGMVFPFGETAAVTVLGRNKLNIYYQDHVYQLKGGKRFNALKYVNFYHHYKNKSEGNENGEFLGL